VLIKHAEGDLDPVRELPYRLAAHIAASEAGQMATSDHVPITRQKSLALMGVSTDGKQTSSSQPD
jgi:hypothetical protein